MKETLREQYIECRSQIPEEERKERSLHLLEKLKAHDTYITRKNILTFLSMGDEIDTTPIINHSLGESKTIYVPRIYPKRQMRFSPLTEENRSMLKRNAFGILEFEDPKTFFPDSEDHDTLILVPGLVFDHDHIRVGYGGGYYDRFLAKHPDMYTIGIGFKEQFSDTPLPRDQYDIPLDELLLV